MELRLIVPAFPQKLLSVFLGSRVTVLGSLKIGAEKVAQEFRERVIHDFLPNHDGILRVETSEVLPEHFDGSVIVD